jgi:hypothetical protein
LSLLEVYHRLRALLMVGIPPVYHD